jgi:hypothetical protein
MVRNQLIFSPIYIRIIILLFCLVAFAELRAQDPIMLLTFQQLGAVPDDVKQKAFKGHVPEHLKEMDGRAVSIRGFMYRSENGRLILASEPNLKSCCVGGAAQLGRQIEVEDFASEVEDNGIAVTLHGNFFVAPIKDNKGLWQRLYVLQNASLIEGQGSNIVSFLISAVALIVLVSIPLNKRYFG